MASLVSSNSTVHEAPRVLRTIFQLQRVESMSLRFACAESRSALQMKRPDNGGFCRKAKRKQRQLSVIHEPVWQTVAHHRSVQGRCCRQYDPLQSLLIKGHRQVSVTGAVSFCWASAVERPTTSAPTTLKMLFVSTLARDEQSILAQVRNLVRSSRRKA